MSASLVPSGRALLLLALFAPVAVVIGALAPGAWLLAPAAALALLAAVLLDGLAAGELRDVNLAAPADGEIGEQLRLAVLAEFARAPGGAPVAAIGFDALLGAGGRAGCTLAAEGAEGVWSGAITLVPGRRGTGTLGSLWLRWPGPLGLAHRQVRRVLERPVRVWPDLSPVRSPVLQASLRDARFGLLARRLRGEGSQFEALSDYEPGMDRRRIDWKASARHTHLLARENEAERDNQIVLALDCGAAMSGPVDGLPRLDRAISAALTCGYVALKGGDRVALFGFADRPLAATPFVSEARAFYRLQQAAAALDYVPREANFTLALATLTARLRRRSLIVLFSDFADATAAELMVESLGRLLRHHLVVFVALADSELAGLTGAEPRSSADIAAAVAADALAQQRALVLTRLRRMGVDVIEAPWQAVGYRLIDRYLAMRRAEAIG